MKTKLIALLAVILLFVMGGVACSSSGDTTHTHTPDTAVEENRAGETCATDGSYEQVVYCRDCNAELSREKITIFGGHVYSGNICGRCFIEREEEYIYFGEYPQTIKADSVTITETTDFRGYYLGSDGAYYAKVIANPYESGYVFSDGSKVLEEAVYYFKVEPIRWRILTEGDGKAFILCDSIIANKAYQSKYSYITGYTTANHAPDGTNANSYKYSEVRNWLNNEFYRIAFNELQSEIILTTTVDNSVDSTGDSYNRNICEDTEDKIFLLSYSDVTNSAYGFVLNFAREMFASDYSRATGVWMSTSTCSGCWWLRSPHRYYCNFTCVVDNSGNIHNISDNSIGHDVSSNDYIDYENNGVVPALWIRL